MVTQLLDIIGVESIEDTHMITEEDLKHILKPMQVRKLLAGWKAKGSGGFCFIIVFFIFLECFLLTHTRFSVYFRGNFFLAYFSVFYHGCLFHKFGCLGVYSF